MKQYLLAASLFILGCVSSVHAATYDAGILSYSITDNKIVLNSDLDVNMSEQCAPYSKDGRVFVDIGRSEARASVWSTAILDAVVSYRPVRLTLDKTVCDSKYGWRVADLELDDGLDEGSRHGVRLKHRQLLRTFFSNGEIRKNIYGYPIEVNVIGDKSSYIEISKDESFSEVAAITKGLNSGDVANRRVGLSMVVPSGYYFRVNGISNSQGSILK